MYRNPRKSQEEQLVLDILYSSSKRQQIPPTEVLAGQDNSEATLPPKPYSVPTGYPNPFFNGNPQYAAWQQAQVQQMMWLQQQQYMMMQSGMPFMPPPMPYPMNPEFAAWQQAQYAQYLAHQQGNNIPHEMPPQAEQDEKVPDNLDSNDINSPEEPKQNIKSDKNELTKLMGLLDSAASKRPAAAALNNRQNNTIDSNSDRKPARASAVSELKSLLNKTPATPPPPPTAAQNINRGKSTSTVNDISKKVRAPQKIDAVVAEVAKAAPIDPNAKKTYKDMVSNAGASSQTKTKSEKPTSAPKSASAGAKTSLPTEMVKVSSPKPTSQSTTMISKVKSVAASPQIVVQSSSNSSSDPKFAASKFLSSPDPDIIPMPNFEESFFQSNEPALPSLTSPLQKATIVPAIATKETKKSRTKKPAAESGAVPPTSTETKSIPAENPSKPKKSTKPSAGAAVASSIGTSDKTASTVTSINALKQFLKIDK